MLRRSEASLWLRLVSKPGRLYPEMRFDGGWIYAQPHQPVTSGLLGRPIIPDLPYELPNGSPIRIDTDFLGKARSEPNPTPGPFEKPGSGELKLKVW